MTTLPRTYRLSPRRLLIGRGAVHEISGVAADLGRSILLVTDRAGGEATKASLDALEEAMPGAKAQTFVGECTWGAIDEIARSAAGRVLVGTGGGKVLDAVKAAAAKAKVPCITVPTSAATCAAYTPLSILHEASGAYVESLRLSRPVAACIVDPDLIVTAPPRLLASGIVDALARAFDTILAARVGVPTATASASLAICRDYVDGCLLPLGTAALADCERGHVTEAFERVTEVCIVGAGLAGEMGARFFGRSFSHAVAYALSHVVDPEGVLHGEAAGLGILVHCTLDRQPPVSLSAMHETFASWGVPTSFAAVGIRDIAREEGIALAARTLDYLDLERAVPFPVGASDLVRAMREVEALSSED